MNGRYFETFKPDGGGVEIYSTLNSRNFIDFSLVNDQKIFFEELKELTDKCNLTCSPEYQDFIKHIVIILVDEDYHGLFWIDNIDAGFIKSLNKYGIKSNLDPLKKFNDLYNSLDNEIKLILELK